MDFDAPWQHALGPGGHYYTPFQESVSASCFRNTAVPTKRHVQQHVTEVPVPVLYPSFCEGSSRRRKFGRGRAASRGTAPCAAHDDGTFRGHHGRFGTTESGAGAALDKLVPFATKAAERWTALAEGGNAARAALPPSERGAKALPYDPASDYDAWRRDHLSDAGLSLLSA